MKRLPTHSAFQPKKVTVGPDKDDSLVRLTLFDRQTAHIVYLTPPEAMEIADALTQVAEPFMEQVAA